MITKQAGGEIGELFVFGELLKRGVKVYKPLVDEGLDALLRLSDGCVLELQIKSAGGAGGKDPRWFQMPAFSPSPDFFVICVTLINEEVEEVWVFPSMVFYAYAAGKEDKTRDLNLETGVREYGDPLRDYLRGFRNRWELITDYDYFKKFMTSPEGYEDLEDMLVMLEMSERIDRDEEEVYLESQDPLPGQYRIEYSQQALDQLQRIPPEDSQMLLDAIESLASNPYPPEALSLSDYLDYRRSKSNKSVTGC